MNSSTTSSNETATLVSGVSGWDARRIAESLQSAGIDCVLIGDYPLDSKSARILVPRHQLEAARLAWQAVALPGERNRVEEAS